MYTGIALFIFVVLTLQLLFPSNYFLPIDRRTSSVASATLVYVSHKFLLRQEPAVDLIEAIDWDVLLLLTAIMIINHIVVNLKETVDSTLWLQRKVQSNPRRGFWLVAWTSFFVSPFLTNDGVCLLFVAPILAAFEALPLMERQCRTWRSVVGQTRAAPATCAWREETPFTSCSPWPAVLILAPP